MSKRTLAAVCFGLVVGLASGVAIGRPAKVRAQGSVYVDEVRFTGIIGGSTSPRGTEVVGFSCAEYANDQKIHCFVASR